MNIQLVSIMADAKNAWDAQRFDGKVHLNVSIDTSSLARGAQATFDALAASVAARRLNAVVNVTGSWGFNWIEPCVAVRSAAGTRTVLYANVTPDRVEELLDAVVVEGRDLPELALGVVEC